MLEDENELLQQDADGVRGREGSAERAGGVEGVERAEGNPTPGQANSVQGEQVDVSFMGENHGSIITYKGLSVGEVAQLVKELFSLGSIQGNAPFASPKIGSLDPRKRQLADILGQDLQDVALDREATTDYQVGTGDPAAMPGEIDEWYYDQLDNYEIGRRYVADHSRPPAWLRPSMKINRRSLSVMSRARGLRNRGERGRAEARGADGEPPLSVEMDVFHCNEMVLWETIDIEHIGQ